MPILRGEDPDSANFHNGVGGHPHSANPQRRTHILPPPPQLPKVMFSEWSPYKK